MLTKFTSIDPELLIVSAWLLFGGSHLLFSATPLRQLISHLFGARGFTIFYSALTTLGMLTLIYAVAVYGSAGRAGLGLAAIAPARWALGAVAGLGALFVSVGLINYPTAPIAYLAQRQRSGDHKDSISLKPPNSIERLTRHPFFVGLI